MARVYFETSYIRACVTDREDLASRYRRAESRAWWRNRASHHDLYVSQEVESELSSPRYRQRNAVLSWIARSPRLAIDAECIGLAEVMICEKLMPGPLAGDTIHVAATCMHGMEHMLS